MSRADDRRALLRRLRGAIEGGLVAAILAAWMLTWLPRLHGPIDLRWDAAVYYTLGTALAQGKGYRLLNEPGEIPSIQYPPALPVAIALHQWLLGTSDPVVVGTVLRRSFLALSGACILLAYALLRTRLPAIIAAAGALICALSMSFVWLTDRAYSDVPFLALTTGFFLLARSQSTIARMSTGLVAGTAFLLRTVGGALLVVWVLDAAMAGQARRAAIRLAVVVALVGGWQGYVWRVQSSAAYRTPQYSYQRAPYLIYNVSYPTNLLGKLNARDVVQRLMANSVSVPRAAGEALTLSMSDWSEVLDRIRDVPVLGLAARWRAIQAGVFILGLIAVGAIGYSLRAGHFREAVFAIVYIVGIAVMNTQELPRYLSGIAPVLLLLLLTPLVRNPGHTRAGTLRQVVVGSILLTSLTAEAVLLRRVFADGFPSVTYEHWNGHRVSYRLFSYPDVFRTFDEGIGWLDAHARESDIIASSQPHWVYLRTRRRTVMPPFEPDPVRHQALLDDVPVSFVIVDSIGFSAARHYSLPVMTNGHLWALVHQSSDGTLQIYERCGRSSAC